MDDWLQAISRRYGYSFNYNLGKEREREGVTNLFKRITIISD